MRLSFTVLHTGTDAKLPQCEVRFNLSPPVIYHRAEEGLWRSITGWPLGRELSLTAEWLYKQKVKAEYGGE